MMKPDYKPQKRQWDGPILTTDGGESGSPTGTSAGSHPKFLSTRVPNGFFRSRCDQDPSAVKPMLELDLCHNSYDKFSMTREWGADY